MKRSSKKYRNPEKKARKDRSKKMLATGMMICLGSLPVWCDDEVLLTIFPSASKSVGSYADVQYDFGVGGKLTWRRNGNLDLFVEGDYKSLALPNVSSATLLNGGVGAGYHLPINDRWGVNMSAQVGGYRASKSDGVLTGLSGGINISMTYRINPTVSVETGAVANHYVAKPEPLLTDVGASAGLTINLTKALSDATNVKMETKEILPVFPVLYSWYKNNSFASVGITNEEDADIENVHISFYQPQYMSQPNLCATKEKLGKGESFDAELTAFFNERMLDLTEKTNTEASVIIEYSYLGQKKKKTISMVVPVYGRNSMSWDDDRRASVFVSSKDPAALLFSKYISSVVRDNIRMGIAPNIQYAMGIFDTLDQFGINYVIDPSSAYSDNVGSSSIDFLQFPYQTLTYRGGDCDDLSILTCSLFEAVGIKTAFITIPGHIFMAFDSGLTMAEAAQSLMNANNLIDRDGEAWVPLEITLTNEGFSRAWRTGAREWNQAFKDGTAAFYAMEDSWKIYDPVSVPGASASFTLPEKEVVARLFQHSMDQWVAREISPVVAKYNAILASHDSVEVRNELGVLYGRYGLFVEADDQFKRARRKGYKPALLNTANVYFARKQYEIALEWYRKVLETDKNNDLAMLGIARCQYELENYDECDAAFDIVRNRNPALAAEYTYLGAFEETVGRSFSLADRISMTKWDTGKTSTGILNTGDDSESEDGYVGEDSNGFVIADTDTSDSNTVVIGNADSLLSQLAGMSDPNGMLRPDAIIPDDKKKKEVLEDPYAEMDDYANLVEELPGLIAQLRVPETKLDGTKPVMVSETRIASVNPTPVDNGIEEVRTTPEKPTEPKKDLSSLITKSTLESRPSTEPTVEATLVTVTPTVAVTQPTVQETPVTVATTAPVTQPTVETTPVTVTPTVAVTQPTVEATPVTVATTAPVTQPTVEATPVTVATTAPVTQPTVEATLVTVTPTVAVTQPTVQATPVTVTPTVAVTQPTVEAKPVTVATTAPVTQPTVEATPVTVTPTVAVTQPTVEATPVTVTPTVAVSQPTVQETPVTVTPTVAVTQPTIETTPVTVATTTPVTQPTVQATPVTVATTAPVTQPTVEATPVTIATTTPVTQPTVEATPVTVTPTVAVTQPTVNTTPVTVATTAPVAQPTVEATPVTVATTAPVTQPTVEATPVTVTPTVAVTQPTVQATPVTVATTAPVTQPTVEATPVTVATTTPVTQPTVEATPVTVATTAPVTQPTVQATPVTVTPTVAVTQPTVEATPVTVATTAPVTQPTVEATPVTVTPTVAVTQPTTPQFTTQEIVIRDTDTVLAELGIDKDDLMDEYEMDEDEAFFASLLDETDDEFDDSPVGALLAEEKATEKPVVIGPVFKNVQEDSTPKTETVQPEETIQPGEKMAYTEVLPTVERAAPRYTATASSKWAPEEVYTAKIIPGMKTYEEEMSTYSEDKSYLYEDNNGLLSEDTAEAIALEKAQALLDEEERKKNEYAIENWEKLAYNNTVDGTDPLFSYLADNVLEEIQNTSIVDKIREQGNMSPAEKLAKERQSSLLAKMEEVLENDRKSKASPVEDTDVEEENETIAQLTEEENPDATGGIIQASDVNNEDEKKKGPGKWPYVAGGAGLLGLFVIFLIVFWKKKDDDEDDDKKDSLEKQGVNV